MSLVSQTKKVIAKTSKGKLEKLQANRLKWQRKATIANNKLADCQREIESLAVEMAGKLFDTELN